MNTDTHIFSPSEIAEAEGITPESCLKSAWALTELLQEALWAVEDFNNLFGQFKDHKDVDLVVRDAAGIAWALDQYVGAQRGQLPFWSGNVRVAPDSDATQPVSSEMEAIAQEVGGP